MPSRKPADDINPMERDIEAELDAIARKDLRDEFAKAALTGIMSDPGMRPASLSEFEHMATRMYQVADAMLAAREKDPA